MKDEYSPYIFLSIAVIAIIINGFIPTIEVNQLVEKPVSEFGGVMRDILYLISVLSWTFAFVLFGYYRGYERGRSFQITVQEHLEEIEDD